MSTRGAYEINMKGLAPFYFYCHWDNYPLGAANRFQEMIVADQKHESRGGWVESFIRGNVDAEIVPHGSYGHSGEEYKYELSKDDIVMVYAYIIEDKKWVYRTSQHLVDFINSEFTKWNSKCEHEKKPDDKISHDDFIVKVRGRYRTFGFAKKEAENNFNMNILRYETGNLGLGNASHSADEMLKNGELEFLSQEKREKFYELKKKMDEEWAEYRRKQSVKKV